MVDFIIFKDKLKNEFESNQITMILFNELKCDYKCFCNISLNDDNLAMTVIAVDLKKTNNTIFSQIFLNHYILTNHMNDDVCIYDDGGLDALTPYFIRAIRKGLKYSIHETLNEIDILFSYNLHTYTSEVPIKVPIIQTGLNDSIYETIWNISSTKISNPLIISAESSKATQITTDEKKFTLTDDFVSTDSMMSSGNESKAPKKPKIGGTSLFAGKQRKK